MTNPLNPEQTSALIRSRRTVKPAAYDGREIPREIIEGILEDANWAPNHGKTEPWRFQVFGGDSRQRLAEFLPRLYKDTTPGHLFVEDKMLKLARQPLQASHVIALCMKRQKGGKIPEIEEVMAVACAVQNMQLTARAHGIGAFWSTGLQTYTPEALDFFGLQEPDAFLGLLYLGYPAGGFPEGARQPIDEKVTWHSG